MPPVGSDNTCAMTLAVVRHGAQLVVLAVLAVIDITSTTTTTATTSTTTTAAFYYYRHLLQLECGPMPSLMAALPNIGGALC